MASNSNKPLTLSEELIKGIVDAHLTGRLADIEKQVAAHVDNVQIENQRVFDAIRGHLQLIYSKVGLPLTPTEQQPRPQPPVVGLPGGTQQSPMVNVIGDD
jgi:hypothetical protein